MPASVDCCTYTKYITDRRAEERPHKGNGEMEANCFRFEPRGKFTNIFQLYFLSLLIKISNRCILKIFRIKVKIMRAGLKENLHRLAAIPVSFQF